MQPLHQVGLQNFSRVQSYSTQSNFTNVKTPYYCFEEPGLTIVTIFGR